MKFALLIFSNFKRHRTRTLLTILSIIVAFVLFAYLAAIRKGDTLVVYHTGDEKQAVGLAVAILGFAFKTDTYNL